MPLPTTLFGLGALFLIAGVVVFLAGWGQIDINRFVPIQRGKGTCIFGIILMLVGGFFLSKSPELKSSTNPTPTPTPTPIQTPIVTPIPSPTPISTQTPIVTPVPSNHQLTPTPIISPSPKPISSPKPTTMPTIIPTIPPSASVYSVKISAPKEAVISVDHEVKGSGFVEVQLSKGTHTITVEMDQLIWSSSEQINNERFINIQRAEMKPKN